MESKMKDKINKIPNSKKLQETEKYILNDEEESKDKNWWSLNQDKEREQKKLKFFNDDTKVTSVLKPGGKKIKDIPENLGYFETEDGTVSVGYKKYNKKNELGFSLISEKEKDRKGIPENEPYKSNTYFGHKYKGDKKRFKATDLSFEYDPYSKAFKKISQDDDDITSDDKKELLFENSGEEKNIDKLKDEKQDSPHAREQLNEEIDKNEELKDEKKERNDRFLREIKRFINVFEKGRLKRIADSDDVISQQQRIIRSSNTSILIAMLKRFFEEMTGGKEIDDKIIEEFMKLDLKNITPEQIRIFIDRFTN